MHSNRWRITQVSSCKILKRFDAPADPAVTRSSGHGILGGGKSVVVQEDVEAFLQNMCVEAAEVRTKWSLSKLVAL